MGLEKGLKLEKKDIHKLIWQSGKNRNNINNNTKSRSS